MLKLGLIGSGIARTQVHRLHGVLGELCGVKVQYDLFDASLTPDFDLHAKLRQCERDGYAGVNVTHPFKLHAFTLMHDTSRLPPGLASVNTVLFDGGAWRGDNTDYTGFIAAYRGRFAQRPPGAVLMMGAGGVGVAIGLALAQLGARSIAIHDTDARRAEELVDRLRQVGADAQAVAGPALVRCAHQAEGLINATPIGMSQYPGTPFPQSGFAGQRWAFDAIYTPRDTEFLVAAQRHGLHVMGGFDLFLHQGMDAFERFSGQQVDRERAIAAYTARYPQAESVSPAQSLQTHTADRGVT